MWTVCRHSAASQLLRIRARIWKTADLHIWACYAHQHQQQQPNAHASNAASNPARQKHCCLCWRVAWGVPACSGKGSTMASSGVHGSAVPHP
jgi:hypothetical protein